MMEVVVTTGAVNRAKLQSNHHYQQTNTQFFTGRLPFLSPNQRCQSTEGFIFPTTVALYSLFVLKVPLNNKQTKKQLSNWPIYSFILEFALHLAWSQNASIPPGTIKSYYSESVMKI